MEILRPFPGRERVRRLSANRSLHVLCSEGRVQFLRQVSFGSAQLRTTPTEMMLLLGFMSV